MRQVMYLTVTFKKPLARKISTMLFVEI